jgi:hypothetical protein
MAALETNQARQEQAYQQQLAAVASRPRRSPLKVDVGKYRGGESESLLRWLVELDAAVKARCIDDEEPKVTFAVSNLAGRAKTWALGKLMSNVNYFSTYKTLKDALKETFEPPKSEFRARAEFLDLKQGKRDIPAYCQYARYLVSCVVSDPIDDSTQVVMFMKGLTDGPVKTYLFREYPATLEDAISLAMQEDFSLQQAYVHSSTYRPPRAAQMRDASDGTEPMDLSAAEVHPPRTSDRRTCHRCGKSGHMAYECMAPRPAPNASRGNHNGSSRFGSGRGQNQKNRSRFGGNHAKRDARPKNGVSQ